MSRSNALYMDEQERINTLPELHDYDCNGWRQRLSFDFGINADPRDSKMSMFIKWRNLNRQRENMRHKTVKEIDAMDNF